MPNTLKFKPYGIPQLGLTYSPESTIPTRFPQNTRLVNSQGRQGMILWWVDERTARVLWDGPEPHPYRDSIVELVHSFQIEAWVTNQHRRELANARSLGQLPLVTQAITYILDLVRYTFPGGKN